MNVNISVQTRIHLTSLASGYFNDRLIDWMHILRPVEEKIQAEIRYHCQWRGEQCGLLLRANDQFSEENDKMYIIYTI